jgi:hypothetical protein
MSDIKVVKEKERAQHIASAFIDMFDTLDDDAKGECLTEIARLFKKEYDAVINVDVEQPDGADELDIYTALGKLTFKWNSNHE